MTGKSLFLLSILALAASPASADIDADITDCQLKILPELRYNMSHSPRQPSTGQDFYCLGTQAMGLTGYAKRDDTEAAKWLRRGAEMGHPAAEAALGYFYSRGRGVPQNYAEALKWHRRAADQGNPDSMQAIGGMYEEGNGVPKDQAEAKKWYARAAAARGGRPQTPSNYPAPGLLEEGVRLYKAKDYAAAADRFLKAAQAGNPNAQLQLGYQYEHGEGVPKNLALAAQWYGKAAAQGLAQAQINMGNLYESGRGVPEDWISSARWRTKAAEQGDMEGMYELARCYEFGIGVAQDRQSAQKWFYEAARKGHTEARMAADHLRSPDNYEFRNDEERSIITFGLSFRSEQGLTFHNSAERLQWLRGMAVIYRQEQEQFRRQTRAEDYRRCLERRNHGSSQSCIP